MRHRRQLLFAGTATLLVLLIVGSFVGRRLGADGHYRAGTTAVERHEFEEALGHFERSLRVRPNDAETRLAAARAARRGNIFDRAEHHLTEYERLAGHTPALTLELAALQVQRGEGDSRQEGFLWSQIEAGEADPVPLLEALAPAYLQSYRVPEALACLDRLLARDPDNGPALALRGSVWESLADSDKALADYRRSVEVNPYNDVARCRLGDLLFFLRKTEDAVVQYDQVHQRRPDDARALLGLGRAYRRLNQPVAARQHLDALLAVRPDDAVGLRERGLLARDEGAYADAVAYLRKADKADSFDPEICFNLGQSLSKLDRTAEAQPYFDRAEALDADLKALHDLNDEVGRRPGDASLRYRIGVICLRNGQTREALRWWNGALQLDPRHSDTHAALADFYAAAGQSELAGEHRRQVRSRASDR